MKKQNTVTHNASSRVSIINLAATFTASLVWLATVGLQADELNTTEAAAVPAPRIEMVKSTQTNIVLIVLAQSELGRTYQLQNSTNLSASVWAKDGSAIPGNGGMILWPRLVEPGREFFRVQETPNAQ